MTAVNRPQRPSADLQLLLAALRGDGGMQGSGVQQLLQQNSRLVLAAEVANVAAVIGVLRHEIGFSAQETGKLLLQLPTLLNQPPDLLRGRTAALQGSLALDSSRQLLDVCKRNSPMLTETADTIEQTVAKAIAQIGCTRKALAKMAATHRQLLSLSPERMQEVLHWCLSRGWDSKQFVKVG